VSIQEVGALVAGRSRPDQCGMNEGYTHSERAQGQARGCSATMDEASRGSRRCSRSAAACGRRVLAGTTPRFVAYSEHCFGTWLPWRRVVVTSPNSTHPLVYVGEGTHANYPRASSFPLRGASCARPAQPLYYGTVALAFALAEPSGRLEVPADFALGETDRTGHETGPTPHILVINPSDPKLAAFPGTWGLDNRLAFGRSKTGNYAGGAPSSPSYHGEWRDPGANILCSDTWFTPNRPRCHPTNN